MNDSQVSKNVRQMVGNLLLTKSGKVLAGYRIPDVRWAFTTQSAKQHLIHISSECWANLALPKGRAFHEYVTTQPFPVTAWARQLDLRHPNPLPDIHTCEGFTEHDMNLGLCGCETWNGHLARTQQRAARCGQGIERTYRYVEIGKIGPLERLSGRKLEELRREEAVIRALIGGWNPVPLTERQQAWLRLRALAPGVIPSELPTSDEGYDEADLDAMASPIRWDEDEFARHIVTTTFREGKPIERAVQPVSVTRFRKMTYPENQIEPWQAFAERAMDPRKMPFPVSWSISGEVHPGEDFAGKADRRFRLAVNLGRDYRKHGEVPPDHIERGIKAAFRAREEVSGNDAAKAVRIPCTIDAIVYGEAHGDLTASQVVEERSAALMRLYGAPPLKIGMAIDYVPWSRMLATIPGEERERTRFQREMRADQLAVGMPNVSSSVGDGVGPYIGYTRDAAQSSVHIDSHYATAGQGALGRGQNFWLVVATLGGGKSMFAGKRAYEDVRLGKRVIIVDPSGPLRKLCYLPEFAGAQDVNLLEGHPGMMNPCALIREPKRREFDSADDWNAALARASRERRALLIDSARRMLPPDLYEDARTPGLLISTCRGKMFTQQDSIWWLINRLNERRDPLANSIASALIDAAEIPGFELLFPDHSSTEHMAVRSDAPLTVISMPGLQRADDTIARASWSESEQAADLLWRLASFYVDRLAYDKPMGEPITLIFDEAESMMDTGIGRSRMNRLGRDHSKWNMHILFLLKSLTEQMLSGELRNFIGGVLLGKQVDLETARSLLRLVNIADESYAQMMLKLSTTYPGEFIVSDYDRNAGTMRVDLEYQPRLKSALLTDPAKEGSDHWSSLIEEEV